MSVPYLLQNPTFPKSRPAPFSLSQNEMVRMICDIADDDALSPKEVTSQIDARAAPSAR